MHSIRDLIKLATKLLEKKSITSPRFCAEELLAFILKRKRFDLLLDYDMLVKTKEIDLYLELIKRKAEGEPLGYLLQEVEFLDCMLTLSPAVLIPRQETEILVDLALKEIPNQPKILWDLCTGSGCMGLAAKKHRPALDVTLADISSEAVKCATENAKKNQLKVTCLQGDLLAPFALQKADFIFCNPPYVSEEIYSRLEKEVHFEPKSAHLAKAGGVEFYKRLAKELPPFLIAGAKMFFEIGHDQKEAIMEIFHQDHWNRKQCEKDWSRKDRFFFLEFRPNLL